MLTAGSSAAENAEIRKINTKAQQTTVLINYRTLLSGCASLTFYALPKRQTTESCVRTGNYADCFHILPSSVFYQTDWLTPRLEMRYCFETERFAITSNISSGCVRPLPVKHSRHFRRHWAYFGQLVTVTKRWKLGPCRGIHFSGVLPQYHFQCSHVIAYSWL